MYCTVLCFFDSFGFDYALKNDWIDLNYVLDRIIIEIQDSMGNCAVQLLCIIHGLMGDCVTSSWFVWIVFPLWYMLFFCNVMVGGAALLSASYNLVY